MRIFTMHEHVHHDMCEVCITVIMHLACLMYHDRLCVSNESHLSSVVYTLTGTSACTCTVHVLGCCRVVVAQWSER